MPNDNDGCFPLGVGSGLRGTTGLRCLNRHEQACAPASSLGTGQVFVPESGSCPRGPEPSGGFLVKTETQVGGMDVEPSYGGSDLGKIRCGSSGPLCVTRVDPMPPLVLPFSPYLLGDRCASAPLVGHEAVCFPSGQAHPSGAAQGEDLQTLPSPSSPVLAFPFMVLGFGLPPGG